MKILILGASGHIGSLIYKYYKNLNYDVRGTYFKNENKDLIKFDISEESELSDYLIGGMDVIVWAIGFKDILKTENFEGNTYRINVVLLNLFLRRLLELNINSKFIYISTDYVFDGLKGSYCSQDTPKPKTNYGLSKYLSELMLLSQYKNSIIVRTSAIMSTKSSFINWFKNECFSKKKINLYSDSIFTPTPASFFLSWLDHVIRKNLPEKVFHISSNMDFTRFQFGEFLLKNIFIEFNNKVELKKITSDKGLNFMKGNLSLKSSNFINTIELDEFIQYLKMDLKG